MPATTIMAIVARVTSLCAGDPFGLTLSDTPFDFDTMPTGSIDGAFRMETETAHIVGGMNFYEERSEALHLWVARKALADPHATYRQLQTDATSLTAAIVRDGLTGGGDYHVPDDGRGCVFRQNRGQEYALMRLSLTLNFEATL